MKEILLYNSLSQKKEIFKPLKAGEVSMYHCGPTVYDTPHIGNYRTFVMADIVRRSFEYLGYEVRQAMNVTDVDDKTIRRAHQENMLLKTLTLKYEEMFLNGLASLNILPPKQILRATDNIPAMISLIETLISKGIAYKADDGIYMSIGKIKDYGALAHLNISSAQSAGEKDSAKAGATDKAMSRIANDEYDKDDPRDFALWKFTASEDTATDGGASDIGGKSAVSWPAPFGEGRPGWHIECSAMSMKALGQTIDIHTGGADLLFPHHVNEIAQSESATGQEFVHYWMHGGMMNINTDKMSKSKGNFLKIEDFDAETISPIGYRYWLLTAHYRSPVNFTFEAVRAAQNALIKLMGMVSAYPEQGAISDAYKARFEACTADDLNMPQAIALVWELTKDDKLSDADKRATLIDFDRVLGLGLAAVPKIAGMGILSASEIPAEVQALAEARELARKEKDWVKADALRAEVEARGYKIRDRNGGIEIVAI